MLTDKFLLLFIVFLLAQSPGCSSSKKKAVFVKNGESVTPQTKAPSKSVSRLAVNPGPSIQDGNTLFVDKTKEYGLEGYSASHLYAVDFDVDGFTDLVLLKNHYGQPVFLRFLPDEKKFQKISYSPFENPVQGSYLYFADLDKNGVPDLLLGTLRLQSALDHRPLRVFLGSVERKEVRYKEVEVPALKEKMPTSAVALFDYDLDGELDLFMANWLETKRGRPMPVPNRLFKGKGVKFEDVTRALLGEVRYDTSLKIFPNARPAFGVSTCDIDQNGYPDILISNSNGHHNQLWMNLSGIQGEGRIFRDYGVESQYAADKEGGPAAKTGGHSFYSACFDYNNDGIMDVAMGELFHSYDSETRDRSSILTGSTFDFPPKFIRSDYIIDFKYQDWSQSDRRAVVLDYNSDGLEDLLVENTGFPPHTRMVLFKQEENHAYEEVSKEVGVDLLNPSGVVRIDLNRDGFWDLISGQTKIRDSRIKTKIYVFENQTERKGQKSIKFLLQGYLGNTDALGATVILKTNRTTRKKYVEYVRGPQGSQNEKGVLFGFGKDEHLEMVEVRWPVLISDRLGRKIPLLKTYDLKGFDYRTHRDVTLCETGRYKTGRIKCY